jgi:4-hydroxybenzoate polyprenyltransferase
VGIARLAHPFPSLLNALATAAIATLAGAAPQRAGLLGFSMLSIQVAIGALNDWADAPRDAVEKRGKPIPSGLATPRQALLLAWVAGGAGVALSAAAGLAPAAAIAVALALGVLYDLRLSRTALSWLPLALALPLVPVHAWLGTTGELPLGMALLYPAAVGAGAALALANGLVDLERDARSDRPTIAVRLGAARAWVANVLLLTVVGAVAVVLAPAVPGGGAGSPGGPPSGAPLADAVALTVLDGLRTWGVALGIAALAIGAVALRARRPALRERGWELQAVGVGVVGIGWLAGIAASV